MIGAHVSTIEAEFSVWWALRLYNEFQMKPVPVQFSTSQDEASSLRSSSQLVPDIK
jgi:hypothetical protein